MYSIENKETFHHRSHLLPPLYTAIPSHVLSCSEFNLSPKFLGFDKVLGTPMWKRNLSVIIPTQTLPFN